MLRIARSAVVVLLGLYVLASVESLAGPYFPVAGEILIRAFGAMALFLFSLTHSVIALGPRRALLLLGTTVGISLLVEGVGVSTGWPFGHYSYTDRLGPRLFGLVPVLIPAMWFMMLYPAQAVAESVADERAEPPAGGPAYAAWVAALGALAMTAWDLMVDPIMVRWQHWRWEVAGAFYGVPISNYAGWLVTSFLILFAYRTIAPRLDRASVQSAADWWQALPVAAYAVTWLATSLLLFKQGMWGPGLAGFFAMGGIALAAVGKVTVALAARSLPSSREGGQTA